MDFFEKKYNSKNKYRSLPVKHFILTSLEPPLIPPYKGGHKAVQAIAR